MMMQMMIIRICGLRPRIDHVPRWWPCLLDAAVPQLLHWGRGQYCNIVRLLANTLCARHDAVCLFSGRQWSASSHPVLYLHWRNIVWCCVATSPPPHPPPAPRARWQSACVAKRVIRFTNNVIDNKASQLMHQDVEQLSFLVSKLAKTR